MEYFRDPCRDDQKVSVAGLGLRCTVLKAFVAWRPSFDDNGLGWVYVSFPYIEADD